MPKKQVKIERVRLQVSLPKNLVEAAGKVTSERGVSGVIGAALAAYLGVPYTPPRRGRPVKTVDAATSPG